jgi:repressor LexA
VAAHIDALERKGYLEKAGGGRLARSIRLTGKARSGLGSPFSRSVPLLGGVVAGTPVAPASYEGESLQVDPTLLPRDAPTFALTVHGDSMVEDAILDGDIVLVRAQGEARPHDVVVAVLDGETTVKRYELRESGPFLVPANAGMRPIPLAGRQFSIAGVVVGLMRKLH